MSDYCYYVVGLNNNLLPEFEKETFKQRDDAGKFAMAKVHSGEWNKYKILECYSEKDLSYGCLCVSINEDDNNISADILNDDSYGPTAWECACSYLNGRGREFILDMETDEWHDMTTISWADRYNVSSPEEAIKCLATYMRSPWEHKKEIDLELAKEFADRWNIPFSPELFTTFVKLQQAEFPIWDSSSAWC